MKIETRYHGIREYSDEDIITFKKGLPGFEMLKKFILFQVEGNDFFSVLHSIEDENIGFTVVSPFNIIKAYEVNLKDTLVEELDINKEDDVVLLNTVTLNSKIENITVNLKAPIVINIKERLGKQIIIDKQEYLIKYPLVQVR
jgi:flagellar assembly factor FliW